VATTPHKVVDVLSSYPSTKTRHHMLLNALVLLNINPNIWY